MKKAIVAVLCMLLIAVNASAGGIGVSASSDYFGPKPFSYDEYAYYYDDYFAENDYTTPYAFEYMLDDNGKAIIKEVHVNFYFLGTDLTVPSSIDGYDVIEFAGNLYWYERIGTLTFSEGIERIGDNACDEGSISNVVFPSTLKYIGAFAFYAALDSDCDLIIPEGVTYIGKDAFGWMALNSVTLPSTVEYIGDSAFWNVDLGYYTADIFYNGTEEELTRKFPEFVHELATDVWGVPSDMPGFQGDRYYYYTFYCTGNQSFEAESIKPAEGGNGAE
ncbi:MAG: leucine-rich repeat domain-containing protein, partial [Acutalibacteraceae bacterium]